MSAVPLILQTEVVSLFDSALHRIRDPSVAAVYATADGVLEMIENGRTITFSEHITGRYRTRYLVDTGDHQHIVDLRNNAPPARGGIHHFRTRVNVGFRVTDPVEVVRRNVQDGLRLVYDHLTSVFRNITCDFAAEDAIGAERALNNRFRGGTIIDGILDLYLCRAWLEPDEAAAAYLKAARQARWDNVVRAAEHEGKVDDAARENEISLIRQSGSLTRREREHLALAGRPLDLRDLVSLHLEGQPTDTANALQMAIDVEARHAAFRDDHDDRQWHKVEYLTDKGLVQAVDVDGIRDRVLSAVTPPAPAPALTTGEAAGRWDEPLQSATPEPAPPALPVGAGVRRRGRLCGRRRGMDAVNVGLRALYDAVADRPDIASVVRLATVTYAAKRRSGWGCRKPEPACICPD
jgi:hypothetical protein